jgi:hypothetical protein
VVVLLPTPHHSLTLLLLLLLLLPPALLPQICSKARTSRLFTRAFIVARDAQSAETTCSSQ